MTQVGLELVIPPEWLELQVCPRLGLHELQSQLKISTLALSLCAELTGKTKVVRECLSTYHLLKYTQASDLTQQIRMNTYFTYFSHPRSYHNHFF